MKIARLNSKEERRLLRGHLWAYRNEFAELPQLPDGDVVDVVSSAGRFVGRGFYQAQGGIGVRILARHQTPIDAGFFREAIGRARAFRDRIAQGETAYRWVFGESDGLPGLVADRYGDIVVAESSCAFYAGQTRNVARAFLDHTDIRGVVLRVAGETQRHGEVPENLNFTVNGLTFALNLDSSQKTGMFLDQRVNCRVLDTLAPGARVLDGHCYMGLWSCHAARAGARTVLGIDTSAPAIAAARANAERNGFADRCDFECVDIQEALGRGDRYDVVLLDPPALAKSRAQSAKALGLYQALNRDAMNAVEPGGYLITSSCSHFVDTSAFVEMLKRAASAVRREVWVLDVRGAAPDHPVLMSMPETSYLCCVVLRVL